MKRIFVLIAIAVCVCFVSTFPVFGQNDSHEHAVLNKPVFLVKVLLRKNQYKNSVFRKKELEENKKYGETHFAVAYSVGTEYSIGGFWKGRLVADGTSWCSESSPTGAVSYSEYQAHLDGNVIHATRDRTPRTGVCSWRHRDKEYEQFVALVPSLPIDIKLVKFVKLKVPLLKTTFK